MGRVEKFRQIRALRKKYIISFTIFFVFLIVGIYAADYSINSLMGSEEGLRFLGISSQDNNLVFYFMNQKINFDIEYVRNDLERVREFLAGLMGK